MLDFKLNPLCERHVPVSGLVVSMPAIGNTEFKTYFSMHFPKFRSLSHNIDPIVYYGRLVDYIPCGEEIFLRVNKNWHWTTSHYAQQYLLFVQETRRFMNELRQRVTEPLKMVENTIKRKSDERDSAANGCSSKISRFKFPAPKMGE